MAIGDHSDLWTERFDQIEMNLWVGLAPDPRAKTRPVSHPEGGLAAILFEESSEGSGVVRENREHDRELRLNDLQLGCEVLLRSPGSGLVRQNLSVFERAETNKCDEASTTPAFPTFFDWIEARTRVADHDSVALPAIQEEGGMREPWCPFGRQRSEVPSHELTDVVGVYVPHQFGVGAGSTHGRPHQLRELR